MPTVRVRVPATSANLGPGFDTLGLALNIYNFITIRDEDGGPDRVTVTGEGADTLTRDDGNIALRAARHLLRFVGAPEVPLGLTLDNGIPLARGLGSSAAARVGALFAANEWAGRAGYRTASPTELLSLATHLEGHPDNAAAALLGGLVASAVTEDDRPGHATDSAARAENAGHDPNPSRQAMAVRLPVERFPRLVIFIPDSELATETARGVLPDAVFRADANFNVGRTALLLASLATGQFDVLREALRDRLHQEHRAVLMPGFQAAMRGAVAAGAYGATLSGAGPSVLAWLPVEPTGLADETRQAMQDAAAEHEVFGTAREVEVDLAGCVVVA